MRRPIEVLLHASVLAIAAMLVSGCATPLHPSLALTGDKFVRDAQGRILISLSVNGRGARPFIVDTAASISAVYEPFLAELGLTPTGRTALVHGLSSSERLDLAGVQSLSFNDVDLGVQQMVVLPGPASHRQLATPPVGILGQDVLVRYRLLFARDASAVWLFSPADTRENIAGWRALTLSRGETTIAAKAVFFLPLDIEGHPARAIFDLGSGANVVNWPAAKSAGLSERDFPRQRGNAMEGILTDTDPLPRFVAGTLEIHDTVWREQVFIIANLAVFDTLGLANEPAALVGAGLFSGRDFMLDLNNERVLVRPRERNWR